MSASSQQLPVIHVRNDGDVADVLRRRFVASSMVKLRTFYGSYGSFV